MLPPVLEIYVVWHPGDGAGAVTAEDFVQHFHGTPFTGLIGGAVEELLRYDAPSPIQGRFALQDAKYHDTVIPAAETAIFSEDLRRKGANVHVLLSGLITHAEVNRGFTYIDVWKLISLWAQVFKT